MLLLVGLFLNRRVNVVFTKETVSLLTQTLSVGDDSSILIQRTTTLVLVTAVAAHYNIVL
jgi:hypothetical protein